MSGPKRFRPQTREELEMTVESTKQSLLRANLKIKTLSNLKNNSQNIEKSRDSEVSTAADISHHSDEDEHHQDSDETHGMMKYINI